MGKAFIIDAIRTPVGRFGGALSSLRPDDLAAHVIKGLVDRNPTIDVNDIEDVVFGAANQSGEDNRNVARMSLLLAGLPTTIGGVTVNRLCASGLQAIMDASRAVMLGESDLFIAGGVESMSRAPYVLEKSDKGFSRNQKLYDTTIGWRFVNKKLAEMYFPYSMGETAENVAEQFNVSREDQDRFAKQSQDRYQKAHEAGRFKEEILPVPVPQRKADPIIFDKDEHPRPGTSLEKLGELKPAFKEGGSVTAGNASGINDGAAALYVTSEDYVKKNNLKPIALVKSMAIAGVDPAVMGIGPIPASQKALQRAGLKSSDLGLVELNEAFASQSLVCVDQLGLDPEIVNVNGGAIAIGHPLGCSGARISTTLLHEMQKRDVQYGLATMCIGVGQGAAIVFEKV